MKRALALCVFLCAAAQAEEGFRLFEDAPEEAPKTEIRDRDIVRALAYLKDPRPENRSLGLKTLRTKKAKQHSQEVSALLTDADASLRAGAASALAGFGSKEHAAAIAKILHDNEAMVRRAAAYALGDLDAKEHSNEISKLLRDPNSLVRGAALETLGRLESKEYAKEAAGMLNDENAAVRLAAVKALKSMKAVEYISTIEGFMRKQGSPDAEFKNAALDALASLRKKPGDEWDLWQDKNTFIRRSAIFLAASQDKDGRWRDRYSDNTMAGTSLVIEALGAVSKSAQTLGLSAQEVQVIDEAVARGIGYLIQEGGGAGGKDETPAALALNLSALSKIKPTDQKQKIERDKKIKALLARLKASKKKEPSEMAAALLSLVELKKQGNLDKSLARETDQLLSETADQLKNSKSATNAPTAAAVISEYALYEYTLLKTAKKEPDPLLQAIDKFRKEGSVPDNTFALMHFTKALQEVHFTGKSSYQGELEMKVLKLKKSEYLWRNSARQIRPPYDTAMSILALLQLQK